MSTLILTASLGFALLCFTLGLACAALRLVRGPTPEDRILALDTIYINGMLILLVLGLRFEAGLYFDIALLIALFGFVGSAALAKFVLRGEVIEP
ncbi:MAG TPA: K+/H+ antiporter subunit F [Castellaniella sp.]|uniref:K+/H+ antiporter subunit F n=1 Tax=Castellaniella sp. TaxID=1955812 RepID=UPI002EDC375D